MSQISKAPFLDPQTDMRQLVMFAKYPIFATAPGQRRIEFKGRADDKPFYFVVGTDEASYLPSLADSDVLIYVVSLLTAFLNRGDTPSTEVAFRPNDVLRFLGRHTGGRQRALLAASLRRLYRTDFVGNIPLGAIGNLPPGTLIERFDWLEGEDLPRTIHIPMWLVDQVRQNQILKIDPKSLRFRGLERRVYEWARVHASKALTSPWTIKVSYAWYKAAGQHKPHSSDGFRKFRFALRRLVERNALPDYRFSLSGTGADATLAIHRLQHSETFSLSADFSIAVSEDLLISEDLILFNQSPQP